MNGNNCTPAIGVLKKMMTAFGPDNFKIHLDQGSYKPNAGYGRESTHMETATRWTPTNSLDTGSSTSRQSSMASRILFIKISNDFA